MAEVKSAKQKIEEQERARLAQKPGLHPKKPCGGCEEKKKEQSKKKVEEAKQDNAPQARSARG